MTKKDLKDRIAQLERDLEEEAMLHEVTKLQLQKLKEKRDYPVHLVIETKDRTYISRPISVSDADAYLEILQESEDPFFELVDERPGNYMMLPFADIVSARVV